VSRDPEIKSGPPRPAQDRRAADPERRRGSIILAGAVGAFIWLTIAGAAWLAARALG